MRLSFKNNILIFYITSVAFICFSFPANAVNRTISYSNTKVKGMGDTKIAGGFNYNGFNNNPALLKRVRNIPVKKLITYETF